MNKRCCTFAGVLAALLITSNAKGGIIIDDFSDTDAYPSGPSPYSQMVSIDGDVGDTEINLDGPPSESALSNVFGDGSRTLSLQVTETTEPYDLNSFTAVLPVSRVWTTSNDDGANSIAQAIYHSTVGASLLPPSRTPTDTLFRATVKTAEQPVSLTADLKDVGDRTASKTWSNLVAGSVASALLDDFQQDPTFDFLNVTNITITMSGPTSWDASLSLLETTAVPEPSSLLLGLTVTSIVGLAAARRRRKRA